jgi:hypothetical protein
MTSVRLIIRRSSLISRAAVGWAGILAACTTVACSGAPAPARPASHQARPAGAVSGPTGLQEVSRGCRGRNAEPIEAVAAPAFVYVAWIGCGGIGFARSTDGGRHFTAPTQVPGSQSTRSRRTWDPALAVAPNGTVYVAYMLGTRSRSDPAVAASFDHGASFPQVAQVASQVKGDFGDRDFIAAGPSGQLYVTWDFGPSSKSVKVACARHGSCYFTAGDFNAVIQTSTDGGKTWSPITPLGPRFPRNGGISAPVLTQPDGRLDVMYWGHVVGQPPGDELATGHEFFTSSATGKVWSARPRELFPGKGPIAIPTWWIDGNLAMDAGGTLYATWDTQTANGDIGWLTWSVNHGETWAAPIRVTLRGSRAMHLVQVTGGARGIAYVGWQTSASAKGYATYLRPFSVTKGWLAKAVRISPMFGNPNVWPGDTIGLSYLPRSGRLAVSWGGAPGASRTSEIWATVVRVPTGG